MFIIIIKTCKTIKSVLIYFPYHHLRHYFDLGNSDVCRSQQLTEYEVTGTE